LNRAAAEDPSNSNNNVKTFHLREQANEYHRLVSNIERQFGGVACDLMAMGSNESSQLGENVVNPDDPLYVEALPPQRLQPWFQSLRKVAAGGVHSVVLDNTGNAYSWGASDEGTLGRFSTEDDEAKPKKIRGFVTVNGECRDGMITQVEAGVGHTLCLTLCGEVFMFGMYKDMDSGKFSDGDNVRGFNAFPVHVNGLPGKAVQIATKGSANAALLDDGTLVTWGECRLSVFTGVLVPSRFKCILIIYHYFLLHYHLVHKHRLRKLRRTCSLRKYDASR